jgi:hypothetical protein
LIFAIIPPKAGAHISTILFSNDVVRILSCALSNKKEVNFFTSFQIRADDMRPSMSRGSPCLEIRDGDIPIDRENEEAGRDCDGAYNAAHDRESHLARANLDEDSDQSPEDQDACQICRDEFLER